MSTWYRGGKTTRRPTWYARERSVAAFYGAPRAREIAGNLLDLTEMGVDVDPEQVPAVAHTSSGEAYEWAEKAWQRLAELGYDGVIVRQWNADLSDRPYTALLYWG